MFCNENAETSHTSVEIGWNEDYFDVDYEPTFSIKPGQEFTYRIIIELTDIPSDGDELNFSLRFQTEYYG